LHAAKLGTVINLVGGPRLPYSNKIEGLVIVDEFMRNRRCTIDEGAVEHFGRAERVNDVVHRFGDGTGGR
jgi:hypothetical protein